MGSNHRFFARRCLVALRVLLGVVFFNVGRCAADWSTQPPPNYAAATTANRSNIFFVGDQVQYTVGAGVTSYEVRDYYGNMVENGPHDPGSTSLNLSTSALGWYKLYLYGSQDQGAPWNYIVGGSIFTIVRNNPNFPPLAAPGDPGGWYPDSDDQLLGFIGLGPQRLYVLDDTDPAGAIALLEQDLAILTTNYLPYDPVRKRVLEIDFPNGTEDTAGVQQIVQYFQNEVQYYEGRNEPNSGSSIQFASEEQAFYDAVKGVNPNLKVLGPSIVSIDPGQALWIDGFLVSGGGQAIDAFAFHAYNCVNGDLWLARQTLSDLRYYLQYFGGITNEEVWQTEQGYDAAVYGAYQPRLQGRWTMLQMMVYEQNGIPKEHNIYWYDRSHGYWDAPVWIENDDTSLNPAAPLMRVWSEELFGTNFSSAFDFGAVGNKLYVGSLFTGPNKTVAAFMSAGDPYGQVTLSVQGDSSIHVVSPFGVESDLPVLGGTVVLPVSELPSYVELTPTQQIAVVPVNYGPNLAMQDGVTITADGDPTSPLGADIPNSTSKINDGVLQNWYYNFDSSTYPWMSNVQQFPAAVEIDLPQAQAISDVIVYAGTPWQSMGTLLDFDLQYWDGLNWDTIQHVTEPTNSFQIYTPTVCCTADSFFSDRWIFPLNFAPIVTSKVRLLVNDVTWGGGATSDIVQAGGQTGPHQTVLREIEIYNRPVLPIIQTQPISLQANPGDSVSLSVAASGTGLQYQWQCAGVNLPGATNPTLALPNVSTSQQGIYDVVVGNAAGSVTSQPATLTILLSYQNWLNLYFSGSGTNAIKNFSGSGTIATRNSSATIPRKKGTLSVATPAAAGASDPSAPDADPDGDGVPNLLEYVFDTNPITGMSSQDAAKMPRLSTEVISGTPYAVFSFNLSGSAVATLTFEGCSDLTQPVWQTVVPDVTETSAPDPVTLDRTVTYKVNLSTSLLSFFHLRASL